MISAVGEPTEIHVTTGEWLNDSDGLIIEGLDLGLGNIKGETERIEWWVGTTVCLVWDRQEQINRPRDPERGNFSTLNIEVHFLARHGITAMGGDFNDDMLKTIRLGKVLSRG